MIYDYYLFIFVIYSRNCVLNVYKEFVRKGILMVYLFNVNKYIK